MKTIKVYDDDWSEISKIKIDGKKKQIADVIHELLLK